LSESLIPGISFNWVFGNISSSYKISTLMEVAGQLLFYELKGLPVVLLHKKAAIKIAAIKVYLFCKDYNL
jgi:hypothetical protein